MNPRFPGAALVRLRFPLQFLLFFVILAICASTQSPNGTITGLVLDPSGSAIVGAEVLVANDGTGIRNTTITNNDGLYTIQNLPPGPYRIQVSKVGFKTIIKPDIALNVQAAVALNFTLPIGAVAETVTVTGGTSLVNTESATVSTVVDRNFAENLPMNGRSFQSLIDLTPGVVLVPSSGTDSGQFTINGQRASSNYWMVDGVSANIGISAPGGPTGLGNGLGGALGGLSALGGTNSLVSVDAMQEFRIQTSTFAPEFGRTPGGQISIVTRSGTNRFHGGVFNYFRNDVLDANSWFANAGHLPKPQERQNDFGGTVGGPIQRDRTFFFFSYEGLRLRLPQVAEALVPDLDAREAAESQMQPYLNAYPRPNGPEILDPQGNPTGVAELNTSYSNKASLDAVSLRIDHRLNDKWNLFGRYNYSPSSLELRGVLDSSLNSVTPSRLLTQTATVGATWIFSSSITNDTRLNYSRTRNESFSFLDDFGGAVPLTSLPLPAPFSSKDSLFHILDYALGPFYGPESGSQGFNLQRQVNLVDTFAIQKGVHTLKFGADYRHLSPIAGNPAYGQAVGFLTVPALETGSLFYSFINSHNNVPLKFNNLGIFAQDTWKLNQRLTLTYGMRWDVDFAPRSSPSLTALANFSLNNPSDLTLAPNGTLPFHTTYNNFAPRIGVAYQLLGNSHWGTVVRGGFGVFNDLATSELGNSVLVNYYPMGATAFNCCFNGTFPLDPAVAAPPPIKQENSLGLAATDPHLKLPYTLQWNFSLEQSLGTEQTISASYIGAAGRRLIQTVGFDDPNAQVVTNAASSDYDALQAQYQRRLQHGLQVLASYTWSHSIDTASAGSLKGDPANGLVPGTAVDANRADSDFDVRHATAAGLTYDIPGPKWGKLMNGVLSGWSVQQMIQARSAAPLNIYYSTLSNSSPFSTAIRPDVVPGIPLYLFGAQYPGGKIVNGTLGQAGTGCQGPFCPPPTDSQTGTPLRQGNLGRNSLRGFGFVQFDLAVHREFPIGESLKLQFRAEFFNVLNHPSFGPPLGDLNSTQFGRSTQSLSQFLGGTNLGSGGLSPLYQVGGPRSIQLALKLQF